MDVIELIKKEGRRQGLSNKTIITYTFCVKKFMNYNKQEIKFIKTIQPTTDSAITIVRGVYEAFRMLGDALLAIRGKEAIGTDHHTEMINEVTSSPP